MGPLGILKGSSVFVKLALLLSLFTALTIFFFLAIIHENQLELITDASALSTQVAALELRETLQKHFLMPDFDETIQAATNHYAVLRLDVFAPYPATNVLHTVAPDDRPLPVSADIVHLLSRTAFKSEFEDKAYYQQVDVAARELALYLPFQSGEKRHLARAVLKLRGFDDRMGMLVRQGLIGSLFILVVFFVMLVFTNGIMLKPIRVLSEKTREFAGGNLDTRVDFERHDEIGTLAHDFNEMAGKIKRMTSQARNANPLTGLPGNNEIEEEIRNRMNRHEKFAVLYCDLDNFKAYNDKYGFSRGDNVILYSANAFRSAIASLKLGGVFLGHEGGDDFVLICDGPDYEKLANEIIKLYDKDIRQFYNPTDQKQGYIEAPNREGQLRRYRFVSVSIGIVTNLDVEFQNYLEIISIATDMKKHAKEQSGSSFSANRRRTAP